MTKKSWQVHNHIRLGLHLVPQSKTEEWNDEREPVSFQEGLAQVIGRYQVTLVFWKGMKPKRLSEDFPEWFTEEGAAKIRAEEIERCETVLKYIGDVTTPDEYAEAFERCRREYLDKLPYTPPPKLREMNSQEYGDPG